jgi:Rrf2 family iron-sulfur cluster assembly transcriptional regulator
MTLGISARYALCAVLELARSGASDPVSVSSIAHRQRIPETALAKVFQRLVRSGLVVGMRGPGGGYLLARPASKITVLDVLRVFEPAPPADARVHDATNGDDSLEEFFGTVDEQVRSAFASITIDRLAARNGTLM